MKKSTQVERRVARAPTGGHEIGNFEGFLLKDPDINSDAQRARLSDNKTADNFVEFMSRVSKRSAKESH